ncbi:MAG: membrane protein insertion efficiency factor YidD [Geminicoccaceae bacterium]
MRGLDRLAAWPLILLVQFYRYVVSPYLGTRCRFSPSCSAYSVEALGRHGIILGSWLTFRRLLRCHPWGGQGFDPVPKRLRRERLSAAAPKTSFEMDG